jgi:non-heme chloroperoxidase
LGMITVGRENSTAIELYYEDHGAGSPVLLIHGFPLSGRQWEKQTEALVREGYRVITYDRRGFGNSSQPTHGYDFDTLSSDLNAISTTLDLQQTVLVGSSMGTGEVVRYLSAYGSKRVSKAVLISPLQPFLLKGEDNPEGLDGTLFTQMLEQIAVDRPAFIAQFLEKVFSTSLHAPRMVSEEMLRYSWVTGVSGSAKATSDCLAAWLTDFRSDLVNVDVPTLVISGGMDRLLPFSATGARL